MTEVRYGRHWAPDHTRRRYAAFERLGLRTSQRKLSPDQDHWGGDLAGIQQKLPYLAGMGVTAIWISPPVDNENVNVGRASIGAPYHGYQGRDFRRIEEHFGVPRIPGRRSTA